MEKRVRVRFAPSPTGGLHMGGVRTALFNYLFAKKHGGDFILRIEDTDQTRFVEGAEEYIVAALKWCGIEPNEGVGFGDGPHKPYRQSERKELGIYKKYADKLIASGHAYYAFDTEEELNDMRKRLEAAKVVAPQYNAVTRQNMRNSTTLGEDEVKKLLAEGVKYVVRLKVPRNEEIRFNDIIRGWVTVNSAQVDDKVLLKSDGMPTYHLAHIVDDIEMEISHAVRGEEWLPSAPAHILIYRYLGLEEQMPMLAHLPLILNPDGNGKISKREARFPVFPLSWKDPREVMPYIGYKESGYYPEAFVNILALLGWNPGNNEEIFSVAELAELFSFERVHKSGAKFDPEKAKWFNQQYLRKQSDEDLAKAFKPILKEKGYEKEDAFMIEFCKLVKEKVQFVHEFWDHGKYIFEAPTTYDEKVITKKWNDTSKALFTSVLENFKSITDWKMQTIHDSFEELVKQVGKIDMQLLRVLITGVAGGPQLFDMIALIEKDEVIKRLETALNKL
ncbi:MAG: glutamate--tRNA ligase [Bacteroidota bacterium]|nr:glutamate--tRNA ligase [Bacteroidota bacterium]MDP3144272.1 glutamate--tRNA ligase [Bacteroidota bacterium]MDP3558327.1 glutamate--tRNA ligase [Bacteroidota bacterium]